MEWILIVSVVLNGYGVEKQASAWATKEICQQKRVEWVQETQKESQGNGNDIHGYCIPHFKPDVQEEP